MWRKIIFVKKKFFFSKLIRVIFSSYMDFNFFFVNFLNDLFGVKIIDKNLCGNNCYNFVKNFPVFLAFCFFFCLLFFFSLNYRLIISNFQLIFFYLKKSVFKITKQGHFLAVNCYSLIKRIKKKKPV